MIDKKKYFSFNEAVDLLKNYKKRNFKETLDVAINLSIIPRSKNIIIKGYSCLPNYIEKKYKICVFDLNECVEKIDDVEYLNEKNIDNLNSNKAFNFDFFITNPKSIVKIGKFNKILNSRKIMPEIHYGTITNDINEAIKMINNNYVKFKNDKNDIINCLIGKLDLETSKLKENLEFLINDIKKCKPKSCKTLNFKKIILSSTMGPGIKININSLLI